MNMIAEEGINSDGREVIMTVQERGRTDAEMTGTTGKLGDVGEFRRLPVTGNSHLLSNTTQLNGLELNMFNVKVPFLLNIFLKSTSKGVGQGQGTA